MNLAAARQHLELLGRAEGGVELGPVGYAAMVTPTYRAYQELCEQPALIHELGSEIRSMAQTGTGARRIYASLLIGKIDPPAGEQLLRAMLDSDEPCALWPGGCMRVTAWLGETAAYLLGTPRMDPRRQRALELERVAAQSKWVDERAGGESLVLAKPRPPFHNTRRWWERVLGWLFR